MATAKTTATTAEVQPKDRVDLVVRQMELEAEMPTVMDTREVQVSIQAAILDAASDDDILAAGSSSLMSTEEFVDRIITITGFTLHRTRFQEGEGLPVYAVISAITRDGVDVRFSCGSTTILTQLWAFEQKTPFARRPDGIKAKVGAKITATGNSVYFLTGVK